MRSTSCADVSAPTPKLKNALLPQVWRPSSCEVGQRSSNKLTWLQKELWNKRKSMGHRNQHPKGPMPWANEGSSISSCFWFLLQMCLTSERRGTKGVSRLVLQGVDQPPAGWSCRGWRDTIGWQLHDEATLFISRDSKTSYILIQTARLLITLLLIANMVFLDAVDHTGIHPYHSQSNKVPLRLKCFRNISSGVLPIQVHP